MSIEHLNQSAAKYESKEESFRMSREMERRYITRELTDPSDICVIDTTAKDNEPMAFAKNEGLDVVQHLIAEIDAGQEKFFITNCSTGSERGSVSATVLARHIAGSRPEIIATINEGEILKIGRSSENDFAPSLSRQHFALTKSQDGRIGIADLGSANHTKVFSTTRENSYQTDMADRNNPISNPSFWSITSKDVKSHLLG